MTPGQRCYETYQFILNPARTEMHGNWTRLDETSKQGWDAVAKLKLSQESSLNENIIPPDCPGHAGNVVHGI